jgi:ribosomal protein S18 acetylase RimI-like enzyme
MILRRYWLRLLVADHESVSPDTASRGAALAQPAPARREEPRDWLQAPPRDPWASPAPRAVGPVAWLRGELTCGLPAAGIVQNCSDTSAATRKSRARAITAEVSTVPIANRSLERPDWTAVLRLPFSYTKRGLQVPKKDDRERPLRAAAAALAPSVARRGAAPLAYSDEMATADPADMDTAARARAWHHATQAAVCDVIEPWAHGTVARATRYPNYYDYNVVRVEEDAGLGVGALVDFADEALAGYAHRRIDFEPTRAAEPLRAEFKARGWLTMRLLWMRLEAEPPAAADERIAEVAYNDVDDLRVAWHFEDFPDQDATGYFSQAREVAELRKARVLALVERGRPVAFTQFVGDGDSAEITHVYVDSEHRGEGRGAAITSAAIAAAGGGEVRDLWICADDEDRPKNLYARLGFRAVWTLTEFTRLP